MTARSGRPERGGLPGGKGDPIQDLMALKERTNRILEDALRRGGFSEGSVTGWSPTVDLREDHDAYHLSVELPGVKRDQIALRLEGRIVTLEGRRLPDEGMRRGTPLRIERSYGAFTRTIQLPTPVDEGRIAAHLRLGVLEVRLPKAKEGRTALVKVPVA